MVWFSLGGIVEGDIVADKDFLRMIQRSRGSREKRVARKTNIRLWDNGLIPYTIATDVCKSQINSADKAPMQSKAKHRQILSELCQSGFGARAISAHFTNGIYFTS